MDESDQLIAAEDRVALLRQGIVVVEAARVRRRLRVAVSAGRIDGVHEAVEQRLGDEVKIAVFGGAPRRHLRRPCVGHMERETGRLQVRYVLWRDEHIADIVVAEDAETVVVLGTVCTANLDQGGDCCEVPCHVYLDDPLGDRAVIDGVTGEAIPYKNIYAEIAQREAINRAGPDDRRLGTLTLKVCRAERADGTTGDHPRNGC
jgi:hypothetical protein